MASGLNCHFVSRFLTTPWEFGQRRLWYFDFDSGELRSASSRSLFAEIGANPPDIEKRLNRLIESPISAAMRELTTTSTTELPWPVFKAISLLLLLQQYRSSDNVVHSARLEEILRRSDSELDQLTAAASASFHIGRITVRSDAPLLYPEAGLFSLVGPRLDGGYGTAVAIPASLQHVFVAAPTTLDWPAATTLWAQNGAGFVVNSSVGLTNRVVIPPFAVEHTPRERIPLLLREMRAGSQDLIQASRDVNDVLARLNAAYA